MPARAAAALQAQGFSLADLTLRRAKGDFRGAMKRAPDGNWMPASAEVAAEAEIGFLGQPLGLRAEAKLEEGAREARAHATLTEFRPAHLGPRRLERIEVKGLALEGSGLIERVKLNSIRYTFAGEKLAMSGTYFGIGFEVVGTRNDPQVFLRENTFIRTFGQPTSSISSRRETRRRRPLESEREDAS